MEKRFLVYLEDVEDEGIKLSSLNKIEITEYYLSSCSLMDKIVKEGDKYFSASVFSNDDRKEIDEEDIFIFMLNNAIRPFKTVKITRYFIPDSKGIISDLDIYERDGLAILKQKSKDSKIFRPYWLGKEVTGDQRYTDDNLSFFGNPATGAFIKGPEGLVYQTKINTNDIIPVVGTKVILKGYWQVSAKEKIELIYKELFKYLAGKLGSFKFQELNSGVFTLDELILLFDSKFVFEEDKNEFFSPIIHYILGVIGEIQGSSISWCSVNKKKYLKKPLLDRGKFDFNVDKFDELIANPKTPYTIIVRYILDFLQNHFLKEFNKTLELKNPKSNQEH